MDLLLQMTTFARVVEMGSLSAAARAVHLSLPAVSRHVSALEAMLGAPLLLRNTRRMRVTEVGQLYYERCLRVLREVEEANAAVQGTRAVQGTLTVTAPVTIGMTHVGPELPVLCARHPGLTIDLRLEDRMVDLVGDGVDVAIRGGVAPPNTTALIAEVLATFRRVMVASPRYLKAHGVPRTLEALGTHNALIQLRATGDAGTWRFTRDGKEITVSVRGCLRTNVVFLLRDAAVAGLGIAYLPEWMVSTELRRGRLRRLLPEYESPELSISALYRSDLRHSARVRAFISHLRDAYARTGSGKRGH